LLLVAVVSTAALESQVATNAPASPITPTPVKHKPRPLTETEANEVRSHGIDPTGMTIDADLPITRSLTPEELAAIESHGMDSSLYKNKSVALVNDEERAAMARLISQAQQTNTASKPADLKHAYIWLDSFMGMTNASLVAHVKSMKAETLKFQLDGKDYDYSGHYTVMLENPRVHTTLGFSWGSSTTAKLVILDNVGGQTFPLINATIWEKSSGFINAVAQGKEWIHSGRYTIQSH
jgi:hypothetical protein